MLQIETCQNFLPPLLPPLSPTSLTRFVNPKLEVGDNLVWSPFHLFRPIKKQERGWLLVPIGYIGDPISGYLGLGGGGELFFELEAPSIEL